SISTSGISARFATTAYLRSPVRRKTNNIVILLSNEMLALHSPGRLATRRSSPIRDVYAIDLFNSISAERSEVSPLDHLNRNNVLISSFQMFRQLSGSQGSFECVTRIGHLNA